MRKLNKRAAEMTIGTLVIIVLAVIVLVVVALGFGMGWSNLWSKITVYFGGGSNVDSVIKPACIYACTTNANYDYCSLKRDVILQDKTKISGKTCEELSKNYPVVGLESCGAVTCAGSVSCQGNAKKCAELELGTDESKKQLICTGQKIMNADGTTAVCKFTTAANNVPAKCELIIAGDVAVACDKLDLGIVESEKPGKCVAQQGCIWS
ncbi:MAG: hypothetical protein KKB21_03985 [Nanoarchaeota archaeon]|nr:hypothetical protein [Nanoarchaeota archaeon]